MAGREFKVKKGLVVYSEGVDDVVLDVQGSQGQLFSVTDRLTGLLHSVNDISGIPIMEVYSDDRILMGTYGANALQISGSTVRMPNLVTASAYSGILVSENGDIKQVTSISTIGGEPAFTKGSLVQGAGITLSGTLTNRLVGTGDVTIAHLDTSAQSSVSNTNGNVIQSITLDTYGHITALTSTNLDTRYSLTSHNHTLDSLSNVTITSNTNGEILRWNGTAWINNTLAEAGIQSALTNPVTGTGVAGQVALWSGTNTINGDSGFTFNGTSRLFSITGNDPGILIADQDQTSTRYAYINLETLGGGWIISNGVSNTAAWNNDLNIMRGTTTSDRRFVFSRDAYVFSGLDILGVVGFSLNATSGADSFFSQGNLLIGTATTSGDRLRVNGTVRIDSITNATGDFVTVDANNVLRRRTVAQTLTDIGAQAELDIISLAELNTGTATTERSVNSKNLNDWLSGKLSGANGYTEESLTYVASNTFTLSQANPMAINVYIHGQRKRPGLDYTVSGNQITFLDTLQASFDIKVTYFYSIPGISLSGTGTLNTIPKWSSTTGLSDSLITESGSNINIGGTLSVTTVSGATVDTDKFAVIDGTTLKFRTGTQILSDIGGANSNDTVTAVSLTTTTLTLTRASGNLTASVPTFNQNTTGTAAGLSATLVVGSGGTGATTLTGVVIGNGTSAMTGVAGTASQLLRRNAGDTAYEFFTHDFVNQAGARSSVSLTTTGNSGAATYTTATGVFNIPNYTLAGLGGFTNPMTTLGDIIYGGASGVATRLAGNTTTTRQYLSQTGTGTVSAIPVWSTIAGSDVTGAALTATNDANVTLTLGGTPATSLLRAASITVGWTGTLAVTRGGTGLSALGTANQLLRVNAGATALEYFTPSFLTAAITSLNGLTAATQTFANDTNVTITSATSTHTIGWTGQLAVGRGGTGASTLTGVVIGNGTSAMTAVAGTASQLLRRNAGDTAYEFFTQTLGTISGVVLTSPSNGQVLQYNGTNWVNATLSGGGTITGSGTTNYITKWTGTTAIGNSLIQDNGAGIGFNTAPLFSHLFSFKVATNLNLTIDDNRFSSLSINAYNDSGGNIDIVYSALNHIFDAFGSERMRIVGSNGNVLIGTSTDSGAKLNLNGNLEVSGQIYSPSNAKGNSGTGTVTFNWNDGNIQTVTLTGNCTFAFSNPQSGASYQIIITQDGTGGRTITWPTVHWEGKTVPTLTGTSNSTDIVTLTYDGTNYNGVISKNHGTP